MYVEGRMLCYNTFMKLILKTVLTLFMMFSFNACQLFEDSPELQEKKQILELKKIQAAQEKELAALEMQKSLAAIEKEKVLGLQKMQNELKEKELSTNSEKELELIKQKIALQESNNTLSFQLYLFVFLALVIIVIAFFVFYFLKRKREDELRAYNDNLKKYFYMKENTARLKIAEKILDTIAEGDLSSENQQKLINAFAKENSATQNDTVDSLFEDKEDENDAEIIATIEHKKDDNEVN